MNKKREAILDILIEECAEVIQAASKIKRFGEYSVHPDEDISITNLTKFFRELADLTAMITLIETEMKRHIDPQDITNKLCKLKKFSRIDHDLLDRVIEMYEVDE